MREHTMKIGYYKFVWTTDYIAQVCIVDEVRGEAFGFAISTKGKRPEYHSWYIDGKCHSGQSYNIDLDTWSAELRVPLAVGDIVKIQAPYYLGTVRHEIIGIHDGEAWLKSLADASTMVWNQDELVRA